MSLVSIIAHPLVQHTLTGLRNKRTAPEAFRRMREHFPDLPIFSAASDTKFNQKGYIVPGLGDAGDRLFGV